MLDAGIGVLVGVKKIVSFLKNAGTKSVYCERFLNLS